MGTKTDPARVQGESRLESCAFHTHTESKGLRRRDRLGDAHFGYEGKRGKLAYNAMPQPAAILDTASIVIFSERILLIALLSL